MRRQRGFTLMEILIAMALTSIVTTSVLAIVRTQLSVFEMNDQIVRAQQNARAGMDFVENIVRRACGGISGGSVALNVPGVTPTKSACLRYWDGATVSNTAFATGSASSPDALEVIYATGTMTGLSAALTIGTTVPTLAVYDVSQFSAGDYILVGDFNTAYLFQVNTLSPAPISTYPNAGNITLKSPSGTVVAPVGAPASLPAGSPVFKAATYSFFVGPASANNYAGMLLVDTNGMASAQHLDYGNTVQPIVEGAVDFQVSVGDDTNNDGTIDQWYGDVVGETVPGWSGGTLPTTLRQVRLSLLFQTLNSYSGAPTAITAFEDRPAASYPTIASGNVTPRYRSVSMIVAPRGWNLSE
jgi:prepilin-type N-terminal cleavage/methylation domain-containing protein